MVKIFYHSVLIFHALFCFLHIIRFPTVSSSPYTSLCGLFLTIYIIVSSLPHPLHNCLVSSSPYTSSSLPHPTHHCLLLFHSCRSSLNDCAFHRLLRANTIHILPMLPTFSSLFSTSTSSYTYKYIPNAITFSSLAWNYEIKTNKSSTEWFYAGTKEITSKLLNINLLKLQFALFPFSFSMLRC